jgi:hypothetical protein
MFDKKIPSIRIQLFTPGKKIFLNGEIFTVDHVYIKHHELMVKFVELDRPVNSGTIPGEYDELDLNRP